MYTCDKCEKKAVYNLQQNYILFKITGKTDEEDFEEIDAWDGNINEFYCKKCAKEEKVI